MTIDKIDYVQAIQNSRLVTKKLKKQIRGQVAVEKDAILALHNQAIKQVQQAFDNIFKGSIALPKAQDIGSLGNQGDYFHIIFNAIYDTGLKVGNILEGETNIRIEIHKYDFHAIGPWINGFQSKTAFPKGKGIQIHGKVPLDNLRPNKL